MKKQSQFKIGQIFSVPLLGGGFSHGYFTFTDLPLMKLVNVFDFITRSPAVPIDIESKPLILVDLRISGEEFDLKKSEVHQNGERWMLRDRFIASPPLPTSRFFLQGTRGKERVTAAIERVDQSRWV